MLLVVRGRQFFVAFGDRGSPDPQHKISSCRKVAADQHLEIGRRTVPRPRRHLPVRHGRIQQHASLGDLVAVLVRSPHADSQVLQDVGVRTGPCGWVNGDRPAVGAENLGHQVLRIDRLRDVSSEPPGRLPLGQPLADAGPNTNAVSGDGGLFSEDRLIERPAGNRLVVLQVKRRRLQHGGIVGEPRLRLAVLGKQLAEIYRKAKQFLQRIGVLLTCQPANDIARAGPMRFDRLGQFGLDPVDHPYQPGLGHLLGVLGRHLAEVDHVQGVMPPLGIGPPDQVRVQIVQPSVSLRHLGVVAVDTVGLQCRKNISGNRGGRAIGSNGQGCRRNQYHHSQQRANKTHGGGVPWHQDRCRWEETMRDDCRQKPQSRD